MDRVPTCVCTHILHDHYLNGGACESATEYGHPCSCRLFEARKKYAG